VTLRGNLVEKPNKKPAVSTKKTFLTAPSRQPTKNGGSGAKVLEGYQSLGKNRSTSVRLSVESPVQEQSSMG